MESHTALPVIVLEEMIPRPIASGDRDEDWAIPRHLRERETTCVIRDHHLFSVRNKHPAQANSAPVLFITRHNTLNPATI
jgi:hypothetical protein